MARKKPKHGPLTPAQQAAIAAERMAAAQAASGKGLLARATSCEEEEEERVHAAWQLLSLVPSPWRP